MTTRPTLRLEIDGRTAHLLIDRAKKRNAFDMAMWQALPALLDEAEAAEGVRLLILRAAEGGPFCAGADIKELLANKDDSDWRAANQAAINRVQHRLARADLPTIAFVEGDCVGGGCGLALACDLRFAAPDARFGITPAKLGLAYSLEDTKRLVDAVGPGAAKDILFSGRIVEAEEAAAMGLVDRMEDDPLAAARAYAETLAANAPGTLRTVKDFVRRIRNGQARDDAETRAAVLGALSSADFREGYDAFLAKRRPDFSGS